LSRPFFSLLAGTGQSSAAATSPATQGQPEQPQQLELPAQTGTTRRGHTNVMRGLLLRMMGREVADPVQGSVPQDASAQERNRRTPAQRRPSLGTGGLWTPLPNTSVTSLTTRHASARPVKHPQVFDAIVRAWNEERNAVFDQDAARAIRARSGSDSAITAECVEQWGALPPALNARHAGSGLSFQARLLRLLKATQESALSVPAAVVAAILGEIDHIIERETWEPELASSIANCPPLRETAEKINQALPRLKNAIKQFRRAHTAQARDRTRRTLIKCCDEAAALCGDYEKAVGLVRKAVLGNLGQSGLSTAQGIAQTVLPWGAGALATLLMEFARDGISAADGKRSAFITNELNLKHAEIDDNLCRLWKGPVQGRLELLIQVLAHEAGETAAPARRAELNTDIGLLREGRLAELPATSRAAWLLCNPNEFRMAAVKVFLSKEFLTRLGDHLGQELVDQTISALTSQIDSTVDSAAAGAGLDLTGNILDNADSGTPGTSARTARSLRAHPANAPVPPLMRFLRELHSELAKPLPPVREDLPTEQSVMQSASAHVNSFVRKGSRTMETMMRGMAKFPSRVAGASQNLAAGGMSANAYLQLYADYQDGLRRLESGSASGSSVDSASGSNGSNRSNRSTP
jgi:hypothetical protein